MTQVELKVPDYLVGIGASAGSLKQLQQLVTELPDNLDICCVIVQHLDPSAPTMLPDILAKHTSLPVKHPKDGESLRSNMIFISPPGKQLIVSGGKFWLYNIECDGHTPNYPINTFFSSVANEFENRAIAIILSGSGSDGARGITHIKENGGLALAQSPDDSHFSGMPENAISTGAIDKVGTTRELIETLVNFCSENNQFSASVINEDIQSPSVTGAILDLLKTHTNIDFHHYKESTLHRRIAHQMGLHKIDNLTDFLTLLEHNEKAIDDLKKDILIGVTQFFRDEPIWKSLTDSYLKNMLAGIPPAEQLRAWVPGCATGEEAYTLAILLKELAPNHEIKVFASDLDTDNIEIASNGIYPSQIESEVPKQYLAKYFHKLPDGCYKVVDTLRKTLVFAQHDLLTSPPFSNMHVVCCRNTLIYFQQEIQQKAISILHFALRNKGLLILGLAETPQECEPYFNILDGNLRIFQKREQRYDPSERWPSINREFRRTLPIRPAQLPKHGAKIPEPLTKLLVNQAKETLTDQFVPPTLLINQHLTVVYSFGDTTLFTKRPKPGKVDNHLTNVLADSLLVPVTSAINHIKKGVAEYTLYNVHVTNDDKRIACDVQVKGLASEDQIYNGFFIAFIQHSSEKFIEYEPDAETENRLYQMEQAINEMYDERRDLEEELHYTREELQSVCEELMAANEELQTTNEELQSVNEELFTLNSEYQAKINDLTLLTHDLDNLLNCTDYGTLFVDKNMCISRFTPKVANYISLQSSDVGRKIADFKTKMEFDDFLDIIRSTVATKSNVNRECIFAEDGIVKVSFSPYLLEDSSCVGAVVTFSDITEERRALAQLAMETDQRKLIEDLAESGCWQYNAKNQTFALTESLLEYLHRWGIKLATHCHLLDYTKYFVSDNGMKFREIIEQAAEQQSDFECESELKDQQGNLHKVLHRGTSRHNELGDPIVVGITRIS